MNIPSIPPFNTYGKIMFACVQQCVQLIVLVHILTSDLRYFATNFPPLSNINKSSDAYNHFTVINE